MPRQEEIFRCPVIKEDDVYVAHCLETNIVVEGKSLFEVEHKMINALTSYLDTFTEKEIEERAYYRPVSFSTSLYYLYRQLASRLTNAFFARRDIPLMSKEPRFA